MLGELKDAATRCVLRPVDASKCICGRSLQRSPTLQTRSLARFGKRNGEQTERPMDGKGMEGEGKGKEGNGM